MKLEELELELNTLINQEVSFTRIAGNTIIIYFFDEPGGSDVVSLGIEPIWRLEQDNNIVFASNDLAYFEDEEEYSEYEKRFNKLCSCINLGRIAKLIDFEIDKISNDLFLAFSNGQIIRSFTCSVVYSDDESWILRNEPKKIRIDIKPSTIKKAELKSFNNNSE